MQSRPGRHWQKPWRAPLLTQLTRLGASGSFGALQGMAQALYEETDESVRLRVAAQARRALAPEPAHAIDGGRPTKRDRRALERLRGGGST